MVWKKRQFQTEFKILVQLFETQNANQLYYLNHKNVIDFGKFWQKMFVVHSKIDL